MLNGKNPVAEIYYTNICNNIKKKEMLKKSYNIKPYNISRKRIII